MTTNNRPLGESEGPPRLDPRSLSPEDRAQWKSAMASWGSEVRNSGVLERLFNVLDDEAVGPEQAVAILLLAAGAMKMRTFGKSVITEPADEAMFVLGGSIGLALRLLDVHVDANKALAQAGMPVKTSLKGLAKLMDDLDLEWPSERRRR